MAFVWLRTREEIKANKLKNFRRAVSFYGTLFLVIGILGEFAFSSTEVIKLVTSVILALLGVFFLVMGFCGLRKVKPFQARSWEIYPLTIAASVLVILIGNISVISVCIVTLKIILFVFIVQVFCLLAIRCRRKYGEGHRY
jgi:uncharacterized membrane protein YhaH (DUF805 family)